MFLLVIFVSKDEEISVRLHFAASSLHFVEGDALTHHKTWLGLSLADATDANVFALTVQSRRQTSCCGSSFT